MAAVRASARIPFNIPGDGNCSICLENIVDDNHKAIAKLKCGHFFHMACVGAEFNVKGVMVCPNCREVDDTEWKYSLGAYLRSLPLDDSSEDEDVSHRVYTSGNAFEYLIRTDDRLLGLPYNGEATEIPSFGYGGNVRNNVSVNYVHYCHHTYVAPTAPAAPIVPAVPSNNGSATNPPNSIRIFNTTMSYYRQQHGNGTGFGGFARVGSSTIAAGSSAASALRNRGHNLHPSLGLSSSAASPVNYAQRLNCYTEQDLLYAMDQLPAFFGSSSSADPTQLTLNTGEGSFHGRQPNRSEDANGSRQMTQPPVYGSAAYPIEIDLDSDTEDASS